MFMSMPIQERRAFIHKHNQEQEMLEKRYEQNNGSDVRTYEGESINKQMVGLANDKKIGNYLKFPFLIF